MVITPALCSVILLGACQGPPAELCQQDEPLCGLDVSCQPADALESCAVAPDTPFCRFGRLIATRASTNVLGDAFDQDFPSLEAAMATMFPGVAGKPIIDVPLPAASDLAYQFSVFDPYVVPAPIDWDADPYGNNSWRLYFQGLRWLSEVWSPDDPDDSRLQDAAWVVTQYAANQLFSDAPLDYSWHDHAVAERVTHVSSFIDAYIARSAELDIKVLHGAAQIIISHVHVLLARPCYTPNHNHGVIQDRALLRILARYPSWPVVDDWWRVVESRLADQLFAVTDDGVHIENSPAYHAYFAGLLTDVLDVYVTAARLPFAELIESRDRLLTTFAHFVQPDGTFVQFGDTNNISRASQARRLQERAASQRASGLTSVIDDAPERLEYVATLGASGTPPDSIDQVFATAGYASFRTSWDFTDPGSAISGHLTCGRLSQAHAHNDETSVEIFAHGHELILDSGHFNYSREERALHQVSAKAHNLLIIDGEEFELQDGSEIIASGTAATASGPAPWVQASHAHYRHLGVTQLVRTFAFAKPDAFVVIDSVTSETTHRYEQHFHLHPEITELQSGGPGSSGVRIGRVPDGPGLVLVPLHDPTEVEERHSWYFPTSNVSLDRIDLVFTSADLATTDLAMLLLVVPPGIQPSSPDSASLRRQDGAFVVRWSRDGIDQQLTLPAPDPTRRTTPPRAPVADSPSHAPLPSLAPAWAQD